MNSSINKSIIVKVATVSNVISKNSNGVPMNNAVTKNVSPRNIKINFLFIAVVCSLCRHKITANLYIVPPRPRLAKRNEDAPPRPRLAKRNEDALSLFLYNKLIASFIALQMQS